MFVVGGEIFKRRVELLIAYNFCSVILLLDIIYRYTCTSEKDGQKSLFLISVFFIFLSCFTEWLRLSEFCMYLSSHICTAPLSPCIYLIHSCLLYVFCFILFNLFCYIHILFYALEISVLKTINIVLISSELHKAEEIDVIWPILMWQVLCCSFCTFQQTFVECVCLYSCFHLCMKFIIIFYIIQNSITFSRSSSSLTCLWVSKTKTGWAIFVYL